MKTEDLFDEAAELGFALYSQDCAVRAYRNGPRDHDSDKLGWWNADLTYVIDSLYHDTPQLETSDAAGESDTLDGALLDLIATLRSALGLADGR